MIAGELAVGATYAAGDRVRSAGALYRCLQAHTALAEWTPGAAPSLWARVLPGQDGNVWEPGTTGAPWMEIDG